MATEAGAVLCPVCGERFPEPPARCFRCETDLSLWWPLDETLRALGRDRAAAPAAGVDAVVVEPAPTRKRGGWALPLILITGLGGAMVMHVKNPQPPAAGPSEAARSSTPSPKAMSLAAVSSRSTIRYVVQPGDSLWRIAASLKGDGRRWPELLAEGDTLDPARLRPGQELHLLLHGDAPATRHEPGALLKKLIAK